METGMNVLISGSTGLVGSALTTSLFNKGYTVQALHRNKQGHADAQEFWQTAPLTTFQAVVHLAGENVASGRWGESKKRAILDSRIHGTRALVSHIAALPEKPKVFLCASAIGYYGDRSDELLDENSSSGEGFLSHVCKRWEKETTPLLQMGIRVINLRFGMVLSPKGGALHKMIPPFRKMVGGVVGSGQQYMSWVGIDDLVEIVDFLIKKEEISGPVNIVSPTAVTNREFTRTLAKTLGVPAPFKVPAFAVKMIFGQMGTEMLLSSTRVSPQVLNRHGYTFKDSELAEILRRCTEDTD